MSQPSLNNWCNPQDGIVSPRGNYPWCFSPMEWQALRKVQFSGHSRTLPILLESGMIQTHLCASAPLYHRCLWTWKDTSDWLARYGCWLPRGGVFVQGSVWGLASLWFYAENIDCVLPVRGAFCEGCGEWEMTKAYAMKSPPSCTCEEGEKEPRHFWDRHLTKSFMCIIMFHLYSNHTR